MVSFAEATTRVSSVLRELEAVPLIIPLGQALNSNMLAMVGPDVPITMIPMGSVQVDLIPEIKEAGINMVHINVYLDIRAKVQVVIPFVTEAKIISSKIPITQAVFMGDVPNYYFKGTDGNSQQGTTGKPFIPPTPFNEPNMNTNK